MSAQTAAWRREAHPVAVVRWRSMLPRRVSPLERRLSKFQREPVSIKNAAAVIITATTLVVIASGVAMRIFDPHNFPNVWVGMWWAVQTVTTVGYGDHVPTTVAGRLVAALVMLLGIGFVTVITASITGSFVARSRREQSSGNNNAPTAEQLKQIDERLERIEAALNART